jgi:hypothetical protein
MFAELPVAIHSWMIKNNVSRSLSEANLCNCCIASQEKAEDIS